MRSGYNRTDKHAQGMYVAANAFLFAHLSKVLDN